jgi:hypothetical protein
LGNIFAARSSIPPSSKGDDIMVDFMESLHQAQFSD